MRRLKAASSALLVGLVLLLALDHVALAATGDSLILGRSNTANGVTEVKRTTPGPVLRLEADNGSAAPFTTNAHGKVAQLNADEVDGRSAGQLGVRSLVYRTSFDLTDAFGFDLTLPDVPRGTYLAAWTGWVYGPSGSTHECFLEVASPHRLALDSWDPGNANGFLAITSAGVVRLNATQDLHAICLGDQGGYSTASGAPIEILLTRVDKVTAMAFAPARTTVRQRGSQ